MFDDGLWFSLGLSNITSFFLFQLMILVHIRDYASGETLFDHQLRISSAEDPLPVKTYVSDPCTVTT